MKSMMIGLPLALVMTSAVWAQHASSYDDRPKITVSGEAVVNVKPDKIVIHWSSWSGWGYARQSGMSQNVVQNVQGSPGEISETDALGKISIRANVAVTFELKR